MNACGQECCSGILLTLRYNICNSTDALIPALGIFLTEATALTPDKTVMTFMTLILGLKEALCLCATIDSALRTSCLQHQALISPGVPSSLPDGRTCR